MLKAGIDVLERISGMYELPEDAALNIRADGQKVERRNAAGIEIVTKTEKDGVDIVIAPDTKHGCVYIPVAITRSGVRDAVCNDFFVGEGAEVEVVAGCGINNCGCDDSQYDGIHTFHIGRNARVIYREKYFGEGGGTGRRILNPVTEIYLEEGASITLDCFQLKGVDDARRYTKITAAARAEVLVQERLYTNADQTAVSEMDIFLNGADAKARVVSRSAAADSSNQTFYPRVQGNAPCFGHVACDTVITGSATARSIPEISCNDAGARLGHEASIGRIAEDRVSELLALGLTEREVEERMLEDFLR